MRAGKDVVSANKQLLSQHGEELFETAREHGVRLRFEAAVGGGGLPVVRWLEESLSATPIERIHGSSTAPPTSFLTEMTRGRATPRARRGTALRLRRGGPERRRERSRPRRPRWRSSRGWRSAPPVHLDDVRYEGIDHLHGDDRRSTPRELGLGLKLVGTAERRDGGLSVVTCIRRSCTPGHPLSSVSGCSRRHLESQTFTEITMSGPARRPSDREAAVLGRPSGQR